MKKQHFFSAIFAIIFAVMPAFLSANTPAPASNDIAALRKNIGYPSWAVKQQVEGRFEMIVYVGENGEVSMVNFDASSYTSQPLTRLIADVSEKIYAHRFSPESAGQTFRIPFNFVLTK